MVDAGAPVSAGSRGLHHLEKREEEVAGSWGISGKFDGRCLRKWRLQLESLVRSYCLLRESSGGTDLVVWSHYRYCASFVEKEEQN